MSVNKMLTSKTGPKKCSYGKGRQNTATTFTDHPVPAAPPFRSRRTLAEHVQDNMHFAHRLMLLHRVGCIVTNSESEKREDLKKHLETAFEQINFKAKTNDHVSGIVVVYHAFTIKVLTGTERSLGLFAETLRDQYSKYFTGGRVVFFHSNVNQVISYD